MYNHSTRKFCLDPLSNLDVEEALLKKFESKTQEEFVPRGYELEKD